MAPFVVLRFLPDMTAYVCGFENGKVGLLAPRVVERLQAKYGTGGMAVVRVSETNCHEIPLSAFDKDIDPDSEIVTPKQYEFGDYRMELGYAPKSKTWIKGTIRRR